MICGLSALELTTPFVFVLVPLNSVPRKYTASFPLGSVLVIPLPQTVSDCLLDIRRVELS